MFHARVLACTAERKRMTKQTQQQQQEIPDPKSNRILQKLDAGQSGSAEVPQTPLSPG